jgi:hypothetical protein
LRDELNTRLSQMEQRVMQSINIIQMDRDQIKELQMRLRINEEERQSFGRDALKLQLEKADLQAQVKTMQNEEEKEENNIGRRQGYGHGWD